MPKPPALLLLLLLLLLPMLLLKLTRSPPLHRLKLLATML
jgi:hypothetical protein